MAVIAQVSQFLPCQTVYRNKGSLDIGDDDRARV